MQSDKYQKQSGLIVEFKISFESLKLSNGLTYEMYNNLFTCSSCILKFSAKASAVFPVLDTFCLNKVNSRGRWRSSSE